MLTLWRCNFFYKIKYDLKGHSWSQIMTFLIKNSPSLLFMLLIDWKNKCRWTLWKNKVWLIQRRHLPCFDLNLHSYGQLFIFFFYIFSFVQCVRNRIIKFFSTSKPEKIYISCQIKWLNIFLVRSFSYRQINLTWKVNLLNHFTWKILFKSLRNCKET